VCEAAPDGTRYHCLELCWLRSPFSPQEDKRTPPPKRHYDTVLKNFPPETVNRDWVGALLLQRSVQEGSWACAEALWGPRIAPPHRCGLPSPLPRLHRVTLSSVFFHPCWYPASSENFLLTELQLCVNGGFIAASAWLSLPAVPALVSCSASPSA